MTLTAHELEDARSAYDLYWPSYLAGDEAAFISLLDENVTLVGTAEAEICANKAEAIKFFQDTTCQVVGQVEIRNRNVRFVPVADLVYVIEFADVYILLDGDWRFYARIRLTTLMRQVDGEWKVFQRHGSVPDLRSQGGETYAAEQIKLENLQLREAVKRRTIELESKNRELEIGACLERVRARAMAMRKPADMIDVCHTISDQLHLLGVSHIRNVQTAIINDEKGTYLNYEYFPQYDTSSILEIVTRLHPRVEEFTQEIRKAADAFYTTSFSGDQLKEWVEYRKQTNQIPDPMLERAESVHYYFYSIGPGALGLSTYAPLQEEELDVFKRFRNVFDLAYRRFIDIEQAEAQAREATIEAALERVRAKAMAMRDSSDLSATSGLVFTELRKLGIASVRCGVLLLREDSNQASLYFTAPSPDGDSLAFVGPLILAGHPSLERQYACWLRREDYFVTLKNKELLDYYDYVQRQVPVPLIQREHGDREEHGYYLYFSVGQFYVWTQERYSDEDLSVLNRFKAIFDLTFRRYLDLQKAEAQAREAQIEASLERVRSRTLAMQRSDELAETAAVLFRQLIALGIAPNRLYICIIKDEQANAEFWITDEDGSKVSSGFATNLLVNGSFRKMIAGWQQGQNSLTIDLQGEELQEYLRHLNSLNVPFKGGLSQSRRVQTIAYFSKGFIGMASSDEQPEETTLLLERFAAVFNLTFTRFNDLKLAEAQAHQAQLDLIQLQAEKKRAEEALSELRSMQAQLLQQEKLASLGQLTAGIAHEIKNPLNFVNNFSSISLELLDEVVQELAVSAPQLAKGDVSQLLADIKANLNKIIEHGTRADGIVRSMLQHSRGGGGQIEPTDLNALIREFANLAFHGMRAGKNPINVDIVLELDESLGLVSIKAEDFSRVIINLCQNAFDAMRDKTGTQSGGYLPRVKIRTQRSDTRVIMEVADNGPGIPDAIRGKVLQPFFTTKKGTQGTGLGLSITHDIVKAHGGELSIGSNEMGGATFSITLPAEAQK